MGRPEVPRRIPGALSSLWQWLPSVQWVFRASLSTQEQTRVLVSSVTEAHYFLKDHNDTFCKRWYNAQKEKRKYICSREANLTGCCFRICLDIHILMFIEAQIIIAKLWTWPICSSITEWKNKMYLYTIVSFAIKLDKLGHLQDTLRS